MPDIIDISGRFNRPTGKKAEDALRMLEELAGERAPWEEPGLKRRSDKVIAFCQDMTITSGPLSGKKITLRPWQKKFIRAVYGVDKTGNRRVRTAILSLGRKNGKTQLAACLALCHLSGPESESRGEVYSCANDRLQASKLCNEMIAMIVNHPWLAMRTRVLRGRKQIDDLISESTYQALSREANTKMGLNPSFVCYDELGSAKGRDLYDAMDSALGGRKEPLLLVISTQAADDFAPMSQLIDYGLKIEQGDIQDPAFHLTLFTAPENADPWNPASWEAANPALGDFLSLEHVARMAKQAQRIPARENSFRNLVLNQRVAAETRFVDRITWNACAGAAVIPRGVHVYAGLDLGATRDLSALVIVAVDPNGCWNIQPHCWIPGKDLKERSDLDRVPYEAWVRDGAIMPIGESTDPKVIAHKIAQINGITPIDLLAFDRWRIADLKRELDAIGCPVVLEPFGQGFKDMSAAVDIVERLLIQKKLRHGGHPVLTWCAHNAVVVRDPAGGRKFDKAKSSGRIDALVSMSMALSLALTRAPKAIDIESLIG
jgi:phage terminase large subunit-like protein